MGVGLGVSVGVDNGDSEGVGETVEEGVVVAVSLGEEISTCFLELPPILVKMNARTTSDITTSKAIVFPGSCFFGRFTTGVKTCGISSN